VAPFSHAGVLLLTGSTAEARIPRSRLSGLAAMYEGPRAGGDPLFFPRYLRMVGRRNHSTQRKTGARWAILPPRDATSCGRRNPPSRSRQGNLLVGIDQRFTKTVILRPEQSPFPFTFSRRSSLPPIRDSLRAPLPPVYSFPVEERPSRSMCAPVSLPLRYPPLFLPPGCRSFLPEGRPTITCPFFLVL